MKRNWIDVGINYVQDPVTGKTKLVGDVDFEGKTPNLLINGGGARFWLSCFEKETVPGLRAVLLLTPLCVSEGNHTSSTLPSSTCPSSPSCPCSQTSKCNIHFSACLFSEKQPKAYTGRHSTNKLWFLTMREGRQLGTESLFTFFWLERKWLDMRWTGQWGSPEPCLGKKKC